MATTSSYKSKSSQRNFVIGITFLAGVIIGVLAVIAIQYFRPNNEQSMPGIAQGKVPQTSTNSGGRSSVVSTEDVEELQEIFKRDNVFDQNTILYSTLSNASEAELIDWWVQSQNIERKSHREIVQDAIIRKLTTINPQEALAYIENVSKFQTDALLTSIFSVWSASQLDSAVDAATKLSSPREKVALQAILETRDDLSESERKTIAEKLDGEETFRKLVSDTKALNSLANPKESWDLLLNDEVDDYQQAESLEIVAQAWHEQVGFEVLSNIYQAEMDDYRSKAQLVKTVGAVNPAEALDYVSGLTDPNEKKYLSVVIAREWAKTDAPAALTAVSIYQPQSLASELEQSIAIIWGSTNPQELVENIELISENSRIYPLETAFSRIARQDPNQAIAKLSAVENYVGNTSTIIRRIVSEWSLQKPKVAADWVVSRYQENDPQRRILLEEVLPSLTHQDPIEAFDLAIAQPTPTTGYGLELYVIGELAQKGDVDTARKLLPRVTDVTQTIAYSEVGRAMIRESQNTEALELGKNLSERKQPRYYSRVLSTWASTNPKDLFESLDDFSNGDLKSLSAYQLINRNQYEPIFSKEQIEQLRTVLNDDDAARLKRIETR